MSETTDTDREARKVAKDTDRLIELLSEQMDLNSEEKHQTPFGEMTEAELVQMLRPMLLQYSEQNPETVLGYIATLHQSAEALLEKHLDPEESIVELVDADL